MFANAMLNLFYLNFQVRFRFPSDLQFGNVHFWIPFPNLIQTVSRRCFKQCDKQFLWNLTELETYKCIFVVFICAGCRVSIFHYNWLLGNSIDKWFWALKWEHQQVRYLIEMVFNFYCSPFSILFTVYSYQFSYRF